MGVGMKDGKPQSGGGEKNSNETQSHLEPARLTSTVSCIFEFALKPPPPQQSGSWELESKQHFAITLHHVWLIASNKQPCPPLHGHKPHTAINTVASARAATDGTSTSPSVSHVAQ